MSYTAYATARDAYYAARDASDLRAYLAARDAYYAAWAALNFAA
jgi:hypothetical protein